VSSAPWVRQLTSHPRATVRLLCFPYAGGGATTFLELARACPEWMTVHGVEYPGRASRLREAAIDSITGLVDAAAPPLGSLLDLPFAVLGYSFGSLVAFEWLRRLQGAPGPRPSILFICARRAPHLFATMSPIHALPDDAFIGTAAARYGGIPAEILSEPELVAQFLPALRADLRASETYLYRDAAALSCPIHVFGGLHDPTTSSPGLEAWREQTRAGCTVQRFPAGHFFLRAHGAEMAAAIAQSLANIAPPPLPSLPT
jgi:surfactin synthase thioesterase subunit